MLEQYTLLVEWTGARRGSPPPIKFGLFVKNIVTEMNKCLLGQQ